MKKLIFLLLMPLVVKAQYGFNATSTNDKLDAVSRSYIVEMSGQDFWYVFRQDKYTTKAPDFDIDNVLALATDLKAVGKELKIIYTLEPRNVMSISDNFYGFEKLKPYVKAIRIGNECFFKEAGFNKDWDTYINSNQSLITEAKTKNLPILFSWADPSWIDWNTKAADYINSNTLFYPDLHLYWSSKEAPILNTLVDKKLPSEKITGYSVTKDNFYSSLYTQITTSTFLNEIIENMRVLMPNKNIYVTEFGAPVGVGEIGNTFGTEAVNDWLINQCKNIPEIVALCKFNLGSVTGVITDASKNDFVTGKVKRTGYYSMQMSIKYKDATPFQFTGEGQFNFSVHNLTNEVAYLTLPEGYYFESFSYECIKGQYFYSSSGATAWMSNGSTKTYEISGTQTFDYIPSMSYGYVSCTIKKVPVYGCTSPTANNYDATATIDDGSCVYDVKGCMQKDALNYNPDATIDEGCIFPPKECLKKRWLFSGCKPSKNNVCDCK